LSKTKSWNLPFFIFAEKDISGEPISPDASASKLTRPSISSSIPKRLDNWLKSTLSAER